ncbi:DUF4403 family protein [Chlorobaculum sp. MV4-Y]|uniref:DUF4403 family protein n=1 Tax=Chlorobaculum sp. MV4-Y TaxID=2976335 RepID=UPI0021AF4CE3|nr:DUF4403 family protein [Chlorobaculum sp. MV4-Y]UWX56791.1 DUF4403 family protein [Chlorobaculum sp. MV4-Y]
MKKALLVTGLVASLLAALGFWLHQSYTILKTKPPVPLKSDVELERPSSFCNLPISIEHAVLANYLNGKIRGNFLNADLWLQEKHKERISLALTREENITISSNGRQLFCTFPVSAEARLTDSRLGKSLAKLLVRPVRAKAIFTFSTPISLDRNWRLRTRFRIVDVRWEEEPVVKIGPFCKNIRADVDSLLTGNSRGLTALLDSEIHKAASLSPTIGEVWHDLQKPIVLTRKPLPVWLRFRCNSITGNIALNRRAIVCNTRIRTSMRMLTDTTAMLPPTPLPRFRQTPRDSISTISDVNFYSLAPFASINRHLNDFFMNRSFSRSGYDIVVRSVEAYGSSSGLSVAIMTDRDLKGHVIMSGRPRYDIPTDTISIDNFNYSLDTGQPVVRTGELLLHDAIRDSIATRLDVQIGSFVNRLPQIITSAVSRAKASRTIDLTIDSLTIRKCDIRVGRNNIYLLVNATAKNALRIKRIKSGKRIRIRKQAEAKDQNPTGQLPRPPDTDNKSRFSPVTAHPLQLTNHF